MGKPVNNLDFWKGRLQDAEKGYLHYSVYVANPALWAFIEKKHRETLNKYIAWDDKVLDAGCGYGRGSEFIPGEYTGVDFSPDFILKAKQLYPGKSFIKADLAKLPFEDHLFDWAVCISIKAMIKNNLGQEVWMPMEQELKRVAKKVLILEYEDPITYEVL